ncbi:MAG TPA: PP2C family serine/threonine-protein phosphatase [Gemmatimonadaceae bacterium]|jgi:protein phosphatase
MRIAELFTTGGTPAVGVGPRPRDDELDLFGMTHVGNVRTENQDHFLLATVHPQIVIHNTSLPDTSEFPLRGQRLATILLVADGVGGGVAGEGASRLATETITRYVVSTMRCYHSAGPNRDREFLDALNDAAQEAHAAVRQEAAEKHDGEINATTMTLGIVVWPWLYVMQVGDSRYYYYAGGKLRQISRDQTVAQDLVEKGLLAAGQAHLSPFNNILSSAIGGDNAAPVVTRVDVRERGSVQLVCSDGLTKHVNDEEIAEHLRTMENAEQVTRALVNLALARGGRDNITVVVGRAKKSVEPR